MKKIKIILTALLLTTWLASSAQWWDTDWTKRVKITADADSVLITESDFLYYYALSELPASFWDDVKSDGSDIRVTEGEDTEVPFDVVDFDDSGETGTIFFKASAHASIDTFFYIYYDNSSASALAKTATYGQYNVYTGFQWVHHLSEGLLGGTNSIENRAANVDHGTPIYGSGVGDEVAGKLEFTAVDFDAQADPRVIHVGGQGNDYVPTFPLTYLVWVNADNYDDGGFMIATKVKGQSGKNIWIYKLLQNTGNAYWYGYPTNGNIFQYQDSSIGVWAHYAFAASSDGLTTQHYMNSDSAGTNRALATTSFTNSTVTQGVIGGYMQFTTTPDFVADGSMQNLMIANTEWSHNKVRTYYNETDDPSTFWITGSEEALSVRRLIIIN